MNLALAASWYFLWAFKQYSISVVLASFVNFLVQHITLFEVHVDQFLKKIELGLETIQQRRGQQTDKPILLSGPGKVCMWHQILIFSLLMPNFMLFLDPRLPISGGTSSGSYHWLV